MKKTILCTLAFLTIFASCGKDESETTVAAVPHSDYQYSQTYQNRSYNCNQYSCGYYSSYFYWYWYPYGVSKSLEQCDIFEIMKKAINDNTDIQTDIENECDGIEFNIVKL